MYSGFVVAAEDHTCISSDFILAPITSVKVKLALQVAREIITAFNIEKIV